MKKKVESSTRILIEKAMQDECVLENLIDNTAITDETIGFHAQQAVEKLLKALLSFLGQRYRKTHDIRELLDGLEDANCKVPDNLYEIRYLTPYAVEWRYENFMVYDEPPLDRHKMLQLIKSLRQHVEKKIAAK